MSAASEIQYAEFSSVIDRYEALINSLSKPAKVKTTSGLDTLAELDAWRLTELPTVVAERKEGKGGAYILKDELEKLTKWKLPQLAKLVASNADDVVKDTTQEAFKLHNDSLTDIKPATSKIVQLKGVGPATASLVLSVYDPENVPFFSDEAIRWLLFEDSKGKGWDRPLKYDVKEFILLLEKCNALRERLAAEGHKITASEVERVGYVIGKESGNRELSAKPQPKLEVAKANEVGQKRKTDAVQVTRRQKSKSKK